MDASATDVYLALRKSNPAPYSTYLDIGDAQILSTSPECFLNIRDRHVITRPIKGTRPRGATPQEDARIAAELLASPKDNAELVMITDLERNDLGRVCEFGSVRVSELVRVETYATVHHLVVDRRRSPARQCEPCGLRAGVFSRWLDHRRAENPGDGNH